MSKPKVAEKAVKNMIFLLDLPKQHLQQDIVKYGGNDGHGECFGDIKIPCVCYFRVEVYTHEGKYISSNQTTKYNNSQGSNNNISKGIICGIKAMSLGETCWLNIKKPELHEISGINTAGCFLQIKMQDFVYKNSDLMISKKLVAERNSQEGKKLFKAKQYDESLKKYKNTINITENIIRKNYSEEQLKEIDEIMNKARQNFLKCYIKLKDLDEQTSQIAEKHSKYLFEKEKSELHYFLRCWTLIQRKYLQDSLDLAKEMLEKYPTEETKNIYHQIEKKIKNKKK